MKRLFVLTIILLFLSLSAAEPRLLTVLFTNDSHGMAWAFDEYNNPDIGGLPARKTLIDKVREEVMLNNGDMVIVSSGNITMGDPRSNVCHNEPMIKGMSLIGYDAMVVGNHEFDFGLKVFKKMMKQSRFPFLSANIYDRKGQRLIAKPYFEKKLSNGVRVAFVGITSPEAQLNTQAGLKKEIIIKDPIKTTRNLVSKLKKKNDFIIALSNLGFYEKDKSFDGFPGDKLLAKKVPKIDLIIGGHTKTHITTPVKVNNTPIVQTNGLGRWVGRYDFFFDGKKLIKTRFKLYPINLKKPVTKKGKKEYIYVGRKIKENKAIRDMLDGFKCDFSTQTLGEAEVEFKGDRTLNRSGESHLGNMITDLIKERTDTDIAFINSGSIRQGLKKGFITEKDIYSVFPFSDTIVVGKIKGSELKKVLELGIKKRKSGGFLQVSGIKMYAKNGKIRKILIKNKPLQSKKYYTFTTNSFLANGGDGYSMLRRLKTKKDTAYSVPGVIVEYVKMEKLISSPESGRILIK